MDEKQKENLEKLKTLTDWMNDLDAAFYQIQAQYVVALALSVYIETLGMFLVGYYKDSRKKFESFFCELGPEYRKLFEESRSSGFDVYDVLRNGLVHELIPKRYKFGISHVGKDAFWPERSKEEQEKIKEEKIKGFPCGVLFNDSQEILLIHVHRLLYDFGKTKEKLMDRIKNGIENGGEEELMKNFEEAAGAINLEKFII